MIKIQLFLKIFYKEDLTEIDISQSKRTEETIIACLFTMVCMLIILLAYIFISNRRLQRRFDDLTSEGSSDSHMSLKKVQIWFFVW